MTQVTGQVRVCVLALIGFLSACASTPPAGQTTEAPPPVAAAETHDLFDAALLASGYKKGAELASARRRLETLVAPVVQRLADVPDDRTRAGALLITLHEKGGLFGTYDARATTLTDIIDRRHFNCVSASVLYNLIADRLQIDAAAQLLPTHARTLLSMPSEKGLERVVVETTSPAGFSPSPADEAKILASVAGPRAEGARTLVSETGAVVSTRVLIGTIYVNRASIAQEGGKYELAESLFARGEAFASSDEMRRVLRDQRAALLSQLAGDDVTSNDPERLERAYRTLLAAVKLEPTHPNVREAVFHNLRAAAERLIFLEAQQGAEERLIALATEAASVGMSSADRSGLRAFALSEVARLRVEAQNYEGAIEALDLALKEQLGEADAGLEATLKTNRISALRLAAFRSARAGDFRVGLSWVDRIEQHLGARPEVSEDRLRVIHLVGNKRLDDRDYHGAVEVYREGVRRFPRDDASRTNLVASLERLAMPMIETGRCAEVREVLEEIRTIDAATKFVRLAESRCLIERAQRRLEAKDYAEAVDLIRAARRANPNEPAVVQNLAVALVRWAEDLSRRGQCREARGLVKEIAALRVASVGRAQTQRALGSCE